MSNGDRHTAAVTWIGASQVGRDATRGVGIGHDLHQELEADLAEGGGRGEAGAAAVEVFKHHRHRVPARRAQAIVGHRASGLKTSQKQPVSCVHDQH